MCVIFCLKRSAGNCPVGRFSLARRFCLMRNQYLFAVDGGNNASGHCVL